MEIKKVAVIGAGVMGSGIAAHMANAGIPVVLLDIVPEGAQNRNVVAESALQKLIKAKPAAFMHKRNAKLVTTGNLEDNLNLLADVDWIVEAVIERLDIKQGLFKKLDQVRKPGSVVSSNTSTIPIALMIDGMSDNFKQDFLISHFFNPPRYMRLLEIVAGDATRDDAVAGISDFCDRQLGKGVVRCKDTPGFIGNRIGIYWIQTAIKEAMENGLSVEEADAIVGRPMGIPKTGVFGLSDLVGIDLMPHLMDSMQSTLPKNDPFNEVAGIPDLIQKMIADGYTGRKGKGGFYRLNRDGGGKVKEAIDLQTGEYRPVERPALESVGVARQGLQALVGHEDRGGVFAWKVLSQVLSYAANLVPEISDTIVGVDQAMKLGYNWKFGPFELIDKLGAAWFAERLKAEGMAVPKLLETVGDGNFYRVENGKLQYLEREGRYADIPRGEGVLLLSDIKLASKPLAKNGSASLWDIGDGIVCLEFHTKMNALDPDVMALINKSIGLIQRKGFKALVIYNEGSNFSAGANLGLMAFIANIGLWDQVADIVKLGQDTYKALKFAPFPVVGAPSGLALGGGCEVLLHCDAVQAHAETYVGLVEVGVGLIPGWGGCKEMLVRWSSNKKIGGGPMPAVAKSFELIGMAAVATSGAEAQANLILRKGDQVSMNRDRLLADAKAKALSLVEDYAPPEPAEVRLPGPSGKTALLLALTDFARQGKATPHDVVVSTALAEVLTGGDTDPTETLSEDDLLELERNVFKTLVRHPDTAARVEHMLETGKPLRN